MEGYEGVVPQCFIENDDERPIPDTVSFVTKASKLREYAESLWWESIPMEMLYTEVMKPQVRVQVDGLDAICKNRDCDYLYKEDLSQDNSLDLSFRRNLYSQPTITSFTLNNNILTIKGENLGLDRVCSKPAAFVVIVTAQRCRIDKDAQYLFEYPA